MIGWLVVRRVAWAVLIGGCGGALTHDARARDAAIDRLRAARTIEVSFRCASPTAAPVAGRLLVDRGRSTIEAEWTEGGEPNTLRVALSAQCRVDWREFEPPELLAVMRALTGDGICPWLRRRAPSHGSLTVDDRGLPARWDGVLHERGADVHLTETYRMDTTPFPPD